jgi:hypothetical protein
MHARLVVDPTWISRLAATPVFFRDKAATNEPSWNHHLPALRILIAQTRVDILAAALAQAVRHDPGMLLCADGVIAATDIAAHLSDGSLRPHVLVLIGEAPLLEAQARAGVTLPPELIVIRLDVHDQFGHIDFRHVPLDGLIGILRAIALGVGETAATGVGQVLHAIAADVGLDAPPQVLSPDPVLHRVTLWLDALMRHHLAQRANHAGDVPGFGVSHATIEQTVAGVVQPTNPELSAELSNAAGALHEALASAGEHSALALLLHRLGLSELESQTLLLCLAPELEHRYQRIFGYLHDDLGRRAPSVTLASALLGDTLEVRRHLAVHGRLHHWKLLRTSDASVPSADGLLHVDPAVVAWLLGSAQALLHDPRLARVVRNVPWPGQGLLTGSADTALRQRLAELMQRTTQRAEWLVLTGEDLPGWRALLEGACESAQCSLLRMRLSALLEHTPEERDEAVVRAVRAACLLDAVLAIDHDVDAAGDSLALQCLRTLAEMTRHAGRASFVLTTRAPVAIQAFEAADCRLLVREASDLRARERMLLMAAQQSGLMLRSEDARRIASLYPFDVEGIHRSVQLARTQADQHPAAENAARVVLYASRRIASANLPHFARRIEPVFQLEDVVLPADRHAQLRELVSQVTHADTVLEAWGFKRQLPYGRGVAALFSGPSGTGKTMAAQAIARQLDTELYIVDLARIVSKYIGETEKNLDAAFNDAERASAVLLFDEADALFGKRSDVKDSHDRYANIEVAYLLQRMETYSGVAILTTNLRQNLDSAFLRRLRFIIEFPKPDAAARERIWQQCLSSGAPRAADLDFTQLARRVDITGGNIRQITLQAAFAAAAEAAPIAMRHLIAATRAELRKLGRAEIDLEAAA